MKNLIKQVLREYSIVSEDGIANAAISGAEKNIDSINHRKSTKNSEPTVSDYTVRGSYTAAGQPNVYDALHSFQRRTSDGFGGRINTKVQNAIKEYKSKNSVRAVDIKSVSIKVDPKTLTVDWEVVIGPSKDGYTYDYFDSRGRAGGNEASVDAQLSKMHGYNPGIPKLVYHWNINLPKWYYKDKLQSSPNGTINMQQKFFKYGKKV